MLKRIVIMAGLAAAPLLVPAAQAQNAAQNGVLLIYGDDKCPTNDNGEEIVVCQRLDEAERFRIPQNLRQQPGRPQASESWAVRSEDALDAGRMGTGSCSTVGPGGQTGCFVRQATRARAESNARRQEQTDLPLP
ncbi:hypothetical protein [Sphingomonas psychrotolerans]|uniref:DUF4189 domain-containing protein n=1 Tax=Sphingomonas psychrotolerans TaxID=1327635 RepID=A0A2K8MIF9_9SPHN|nr:hypothetical protein [Sphingomonas psychrotolerans]ATY32784.1 hypothetical protein CVN68_13020 [Sphingomonas psychrotolerans]